MTEKLNIFLLIGQSNMAGRGRLNDVAVLDHPQVYMFREGNWVPAVEPLHTDKPKIAGIGLGMSFAIELLKTSDLAPIGLIPCAVGGTPLSRWMPGADLYNNAISISKAALERGELKGILWHQGEGDSGNYDDAASYGERFQDMICRLRSELSADGIPVLAGELGPFLRNRESPRFFELVNEKLQDLEGILPAYTCVSAEGFTDNGDSLHFDAISLRTFGTRYANSYRKLITTEQESRTKPSTASE